MGLNLEYINGQTPLDEDEKEGLLIPTITTRGELNEFEQLNIDETNHWLLGKKFTSDKALTEKFVKELHKRMFGNVWKWAGEFRTTNKNIGVDKYLIGVELKMLLDNAKYWIENNTFPEDEIAVRFSHQIVKIHCFANGNGRHSRMIGDILIEKCFGKEPFSWGGKSLTDISETRTKYISALKEADENHYQKLIEFARN
ncbi:Filamentation induced by cAMP protein Fic [hydrothermal vent metagenome]|uniref:Filamentation induced by cAMP protein Fic n=1 Tax=hydrothermal vent metagenome TaxID=652676 RepID=A0A3B1CL70_9ZZZZ